MQISIFGNDLKSELAEPNNIQTTTEDKVVTASRYSPHPDQKLETTGRSPPQTSQAELQISGEFSVEYSKHGCQTYSQPTFNQPKAVHWQTCFFLSGHLCKTLILNVRYRPH